MPKNDNSLLAYGMSSSQSWDIGYSLCADGAEFDCGRLSEFPLDKQMEVIQDWNISGYKVDYCLSSQQSTDNLCSVDYSFSIMLSKSFPTQLKKTITDSESQSFVSSTSSNAFLYATLHYIIQVPRIVH